MVSAVDQVAGPKSWAQMRLGLGLFVAIAVTITGVTAGSASANPIAGGETTLRLDKPVAKLLKKNGVKVQRVKPAKVRDGAVRFPVIGGKLNPTSVAGKIKHSGGLSFKAGKKRLVAKNFVILTGKKNVLRAKVGKSKVNLLKVDLSRAQISRDGFGITVMRVGISLTGTAAKALNSTFGVKLFSKNLRIGHAVVKTQPESVGLAAEGSTDLALDPDTAEALTSLGVTAAPIDPASVTPVGELSFPITGGRANASTFAGSISHSGGISLTAGMTRVELTDFRINVDSDPDLTARLGDSRVSILSLDLSGLNAGVDGLDITLGNVVASLTAQAAAALNEAFGVTAFTEGLVLGTATVNAVTR